MDPTLSLTTSPYTSFQVFSRVGNEMHLGCLRCDGRFVTTSDGKNTVLDEYGRLRAQCPDCKCVPVMPPPRGAITPLQEFINMLLEVTETRDWNPRDPVDLGALNVALDPAYQLFKSYLAKRLEWGRAIRPQDWVYDSARNDGLRIRIEGRGVGDSGYDLRLTVLLRNP